MEESKSSNNKIPILILGVLLVAALIYTFYNNSEHKKLTDAIEEEKTEIAQNLDSLIVKYEDAIADNTSMSNELAFERDRIIALRDSIKDIKATNYSLIRKYRKQIASLEETNRRLFYLNDSLTVENQGLIVNLDSANVKITRQIANIDTLTQKNLTLSEKVAIGSVLKVNKAKGIAMRERNNGKLVETSRSRNTDAFRINFTIGKNQIAEQGERDVFVQITDVQGNVIASKGEVDINGVTIAYSDRTLVNYLNEAVDVISLVEVNRDLIKKGIYNINIYVEDKLVGATKTTLK
jgi:hypothetical protein